MSDTVSQGLAFLDSLEPHEQRAFLGLFAGARFPWLSVNGDQPFMGKAECGWVNNWRDFYGVRLKAAGLFRFEESDPRPALGDARPGATYVKIDCGPTDLGWDVREAYWARWQERVDQRAKEMGL